MADRRQEEVSDKLSLSPREASVRALHDVYRRGELRVLVGNGLSIGSGLPTWESLNRGLLRALVAADADDLNLWMSLLSPAVPAVADSIYSILTRDGAADFVKLAQPGSFLQFLADALYGGRTVEQLELTGAHLQLAAISGGAPILTTNFDPLIELAIARIQNALPEWRQFREGPGARRKFLARRVEHIHGWVDPDGSAGEPVVLTESDYFELAADRSRPANRRLFEVFTRPGATLILGMSMADINIRRLLYVLKADVSPVYIVLKRTGDIVDSYTSAYWQDRNVRLLFIDHYDEIAALLRDIQWGVADAGADPPWLPASLASLARRGVSKQLLFDDGWQEAAHQALVILRNRIRTMFAIPAEEQVHLALFVPVTFASVVSIAVVATSRACRKGKAARAFARKRALRIGRGAEQGIAGIAFTYGIPRQAVHGDTGMDLNFTDAMLSEWVTAEGYRDWRSVIAIPHVAPPECLPVGVVTMTSNRQDPFWGRFGEGEKGFRDELSEWVNETATWLLGGF